MRFFTLLLVFLSLAVQGQTAPVESGGVEFFSPQGTVKDVRQVAARFGEAMVRFGDPRLESPFEVDCPAKGSGRWVDGRNFVFDFEQDLPAGIRCSFRLRPGLKTLSGQALGGQNQFIFDTGGPSVVSSLPDDGSSSVDENPLFILKLDAKATAQSVLQNTRCEVEGLAERIETNLVQGEERTKLLAGPIRQANEYFFENAPDDRLLVLQCRRNFPPEATVRLVWGAGISSESGIATSEDQILNFTIRPAFTARFQCEKVNEKSHCIPFLPMNLSFSAPVPTALANKAQLLDANGKSYPQEEVDPKKKPAVEELKFAGPFPENTHFRLILPEDLHDDAGRKLENATSFPLAVATDEYPPLAKFSGEFGIIEAREGGILPVTLRNLEAKVSAKRSTPGLEGIPGKLQKLDQNDFAIANWLRKVKKAGDTRYEALPKASEDEETRYRNLTGTDSVFGPDDKAQAFDIPKPGGAKEFEVVGIPLKEPGFYVVELASPRLGAALLGEDRPRYVATSALVTNLSVHFKWGRESSLVWVTSLDKSQPVVGAEVRISDFCTGAELWHGRTGADGIARVEGSDTLPDHEDSEQCYEGSTSHSLFISARTEGDMSFAITSWDKGIQPDDFKLTTGYESETKVAHAVFDRTLFRAGETVSMKIFLRRRTGAGFAAYGDDLPDTLEIRHAGSDEKFSQPVGFDEHGIALTTWAIPKEAKLGHYDAVLRKGEEWFADAGSFQVEQFRIPTMKAQVQPAADYLVNARDTQVDLFVSYLSGGGAAMLPVKLRTQVRSRSVDFPDYEDYQFGGEDIKEGMEESTGQAGEEEIEESSPAQVLPLVLDKAGAARAKIPNLPVLDKPKELLAELEYQDANGQMLSVARHIPLWPAGIVLGIKQEGWAANKDQLRFQVAAINPAGKPAKGQRIKVELFQKTTYSYRKRLIGGFYDYDNQTEYKKLSPSCEESANAEGIIACELKPGISGDVVLRASARDDKGNTAIATRDVWVAGGDDWWFDNGPSDRMDVLPEQKTQEPGQKARLQVRMPFREATALVTVEREGVLDSYVMPLSGKEPVVDLPIKPNYAPNVYVSVLAVRGRAEESFSWFKTLARKLGFKLEDKTVTALVDLNKPAYRLGLAQLDVGWTPNRLDVRVQPDHEVYKVREKSRVKVKVARADGGPLPPDAEIALAAVDEGLLELKPNNSWKLLDKMMGKRGIEVYTATAQMQVVGKRHYGRKAIPHGGGGGRQTARELFDTLLLWQGRLPLNAQGEAEVEVPLNDSLTGFHLAAIANAGFGLFGTGEGSIRTTQDVMLHSGLPPLVRENDAFKAVFTLRNASSRKLNLTAKAKWSTNLPAKPANCPESGAPPAGDQGGGLKPALPPNQQPCPPAIDWKELPPIQAELEPGEARELAWDVTAPVDASKLSWEVGAETADGSARDLLKVSQEVIPVWPVRVYQATLEQIDKPLAMSVERPAGAIAGRGGIRISLRAKLGDGLGGVLDYMGRYPYSCMEQRISKAIALRNEAMWEGIVKAMPTFIDNDGLLKYFASESLRGSDVLTSYALSIAHEAGWEIPDDSQTRLLDGLKDFVSGKVKRASALSAADLALRKLAAIEALSRYGQAKPEMLDSITIDPNVWPTSAVIDWINILKRTEAIPKRTERLQQAQQIIRSRLNLQGTTMGFSTEEGDRLWWLMVSPDENSVRALLALLDLPQWKPDIPRLVTGSLGRQHRGHWDTTPANAWGTLAMEKFSEAFEAVPVAGYTEAELAGVKKGMQWTETTKQSAINFPWGEGAENLTVKHTGQGKPWAIVQSRAALPLQQPLFTGYSIKRTIEPVEQKQAGVWSRGDVARIRLDLDAQADMAWVVVDDPVPSGATILGSGLGGDSQMLTAGEKQEGWVWPAFEERRFEAFRAYYEYVPKGRWSFEYTIRLNNPGRYELPATRVEALYAPEMFGESPNQVWEIR